MTAGFREFEFDLPGALLSALVDVLDGMDAASLTVHNLKDIPDEAQGVYQLFLAADTVYIGKTDAEAGLKARLLRHALTIQHRQNLNPSEVMFKAVRIFVFTAMDLETQLIQHYDPSWNNSGFGSNDPGRERDTTNVKPTGFDALYPIDLDQVVTLTDIPHTVAAETVIAQLRKHLPYTLRVEANARGSRVIHPDFKGATVELPPEPRTTRKILTAVLKTMPPGWQATLLPGRIIIYKENREYLFGEIIACSG